MMKPTIHLNGTSKESLLKGYEKAYDAVRLAAEAVAEIGPNGRDFYPQGPEAIGKAMEEHRERMKSLECILGDLQELANAIQSQEE